MIMNNPALQIHCCALGSFPHSIAVKYFPHLFEWSHHDTSWKRQKEPTKIVIRFSCVSAEKILIKIQLHMKINYGSPHASRFLNKKNFHRDFFVIICYLWILCAVTKNADKMYIIYDAYPCRSSGMESSMSAIFNRLNPPTLKLIVADDLLLKFPLLSVNPCKSNVPNGFFIFAAFESFKFNVKFCLKRLPPAERRRG